MHLCGQRYGLIRDVVLRREASRYRAVECEKSKIR